MSPLRPVLPALVCLLAITACGSERGADRGSDGARQQMYDVAADEQATPAAIVEAGGPDEVAVSGTGHVLVSSLVESDDDEGPQASAWRLYDADGAQVAEGLGTRVSEASASPDLWPLADGVLMAPESGVADGLVVVGHDGAVTEVVRRREESPARAGDVLVTPGEVYRPADGATYRLPKVPGRGIDVDTVVDDDGGLWLLRDSAGRDASTVLHCPSGAPPCAETTVPNDGPAFAIGLDVAAGRVYAPVVEPSMDAGGLRALFVADGETWAPVDLAGIDPGGWYLPTVSALTDGTLLLGDVGAPWYVGGDGAWESVRLPDGLDPDFARVAAGGDRIHATGRVPEDGYTSGDLGASWDPLPR